MPLTSANQAPPGAQPHVHTSQMGHGQRTVVDPAADALLGTGGGAGAGACALECRPQVASPCGRACTPYPCGHPLPPTPRRRGELGTMQGCLSPTSPPPPKQYTRQHLSGYLVGIIRWLECGHASKPPGRMRVSEFTNGSLRLGTRAGRKDVREIRPAGSNSRMNG